jgi:hypothetical protein
LLANLKGDKNVSKVYEVVVFKLKPGTDITQFKAGAKM